MCKVAGNTGTVPALESYWLKQQHEPIVQDPHHAGFLTNFSQLGILEIDSIPLVARHLSITEICLL